VLLPLLEIAELQAALGVSRLFTRFDILPQSVAFCSQKATDDRTTDAMTRVCETPLDVPQTTIQPLVTPHRVACGVRFNQRQPARFQGRVFFSAVLRPPPTRRWRPTNAADSPSLSSRLPRPMVFSVNPLICASSPSLGASAPVDSDPTDQRRCASSRRLNTRLMY